MGMVLSRQKGYKTMSFNVYVITSALKCCQLEVKILFYFVHNNQLIAWDVMLNPNHPLPCDIRCNFISILLFHTETH